MPAPARVRNLAASRRIALSCHDGAIEAVPEKTMLLNDRALRLADQLAANADALRITVSHTPGGARFIDCGVEAEGGLAAGLGLARVCLADLAEVSLQPPSLVDLPCPLIQVAA